MSQEFTLELRGPEPDLPTPASVRAYVVEMVLELTALALSVGDRALARDLGDVLERNATAPSALQRPPDQRQ